MNRKIVLAFSIVLAILAILLMQMYKANLAREMGVAGKRVKLLVARADIPALSEIQANQIEVKEYPANFAPPRHMPDSFREDVIGQQALFAIRKGQPILTTDLASAQSDAALSRVITAGMRALALPVDKVSSFGGLLRPKDHVDILGTFQKPGEGDVESVTLLQNVAVLAVGGQLGAGRESMSTGKGKEKQNRMETVVVLVTPEEAELLVFAQDRGALSLTMRNEADVDTEMALDGKNFTDIFRPEERSRIQTIRNTRPEDPEPGIQIIKGGKGSKR